MDLIDCGGSCLNIYMHYMQVLGSEEAYFCFPEKEERLRDLLHMFLPLISEFVHSFDAVQGAFYPTFLGTCTIPLYPVHTDLYL